MNLLKKLTLGAVGAAALFGFSATAEASHHHHYYSSHRYYSHGPTVVYRSYPRYYGSYYDEPGYGYYGPSYGYYGGPAYGLNFAFGGHRYYGSSHHWHHR